MKEIYTPSVWKKIEEKDYQKYGIGNNDNIAVLSAWTYEKHFIELVECENDSNFMRDIIVEYYGLVADKEMQKNMGIEPKWLFQNKIEDTEVTMTVVQSLTDDKIYSASIFFNKNNQNYGLNILCANFPLKEFDYITSPLYISIEEFIKNF